MPKDPTKTLTIRNKAVSQIGRRFNEIKRVVTETIVSNKVLTNASAAPHSRFAFLRDPEKIDEFAQWLHTQIEAEILTSSRVRSHWLNAFVSAGYASGFRKTRVALGRKYRLPHDSVFANPAHVERARLLYIRTLSQLRGVTGVMEQQMVRILADGILQGKGAREVARQLNDRVDKIGKVRSRLIARTEIVNAHNVASISEGQSISSAIGERVDYIWLTALDGRERDSHRARHKQVYSKSKVDALIGEPNCRCSVSAWLDDFDKNKL